MAWSLRPIEGATGLTYRKARAAKADLDKQQAERVAQEEVPTRGGLSDENIRNLLTSAFEGGSNYWYAELEPHPDNDKPEEDFWIGGPQQGETYYHWAQLMPLTEGCAVMFRDRETGQRHTLDCEACERGATHLQQYPRHFAAAVADDGDADTGDAFLQCCIFGEVVYS